MSKRICAHCRKPVRDSCVMALNRCWHKEHFMCAQCKKPFNNSKYIEEGGQAYCETDWKALFQNNPKCAQCNLPIEGKVTTALGKTWHKEHFVCAHCQKPIKESKYFTENEKPYCEADYKTLFKGKGNQASGGQGNQASGSQGNQASGGQGNQASGSQGNQASGSQGNQASGSQGNQASGGQVNQASGGIPICAECNKPITDTVLSALGKQWHKDHFVCAHCKKPIQGSMFKSNDGKPYCDNDYNALFGKRCSGCGEQIQDAVLLALDKPWHKQCFVCYKCRKPIKPQEGFTEKNGKPFCVACAI